MSTIYNRVEKAIQELKYPPLNGGPTKDDIIELLEAVVADYDDPEEDEAYLDLQEDIDDLCDGINSAIRALESLDDISEIDGIIEDLRRL